MWTRKDEDRNCMETAPLRVFLQNTFFQTPNFYSRMLRSTTVKQIFHSANLFAPFFQTPNFYSRTPRSTTVKPIFHSTNLFGQSDFFLRCHRFCWRDKRCRHSELHIYLEWELESKKRSQKWRKLKSYSDWRQYILDVKVSFNCFFSGRSETKLPGVYRNFLFWLLILWVYEKLELAGENGIKAVYDLQSYWTSMAAILTSLFSLTEWLKFLLQIYIELTVPTRAAERIRGARGKSSLGAPWHRYF